MNFDDIERLVRRIERSDITTFVLSDDTSSLTLRLAPNPSERQPAAPLPDATHQAAAPEARSLRSPDIGRLRLRHPEAAANEEDRFPRAVAGGDIVAFLDVGSCLRPVVAEEDATIGPPLQAEGSLVGYGTPLFPLV